MDDYKVLRDEALRRMFAKPVRDAELESRQASLEAADGSNIKHGYGGMPYYWDRAGGAIASEGGYPEGYDMDGKPPPGYGWAADRAWYEPYPKVPDANYEARVSAMELDDKYLFKMPKNGRIQGGPYTYPDRYEAYQESLHDQGKIGEDGWSPYERSKNAAIKKAMDEEDAKERDMAKRDFGSSDIEPPPRPIPGPRSESPPEPPESEVAPSESAAPPESKVDPKETGAKKTEPVKLNTAQNAHLVSKMYSDGAAKESNAGKSPPESKVDPKETAVDYSKVSPTEPGAKSESKSEPKGGELSPKERDSMTKARTKAATTASNATPKERMDIRDPVEWASDADVKTRYATNKAAGETNRRAGFGIDSNPAAREKLKSLLTQDAAKDDPAGTMKGASKAAAYSTNNAQRAPERVRVGGPGVYGADGDPWSYQIDAGGSIKVSKDGTPPIDVPADSAAAKAIMEQISSGQLKRAK